jgi:hypothetical protein
MFQKRLCQLILIWVTLLIAGIASIATAQPLKGPCDATITINSVKYLGKSGGDDQIEVKWSTSAASSCVKFGAGNGDLPAAQQDSFSAPQAAGFKVQLRVKRKGGTLVEAEKAAGVIVGTNASVTTVVDVPRGLLSLDPEFCSVTVTANTGANFQKRAILNGTGVPNFSTATQAFETFTTYPIPSLAEAECFPGVQITGLTFTPGNGTASDALTISWNATPPTACEGQVLFLSVSVKGNRTDRTRFAVNFETQQKSGSQTVQLGTSSSPIGAYKVIVAANKISAGGTKGVFQANF